MAFIIKIDAERDAGGTLVPKWMHLLIPDARVSEHFIITSDRWLLCLYGCGTAIPLFTMLSQLIAGSGIIAFDFNTRTVVEQEGLSCPVLKQLFLDYSSQYSNAKSVTQKEGEGCEKGCIKEAKGC